MANTPDQELYALSWRNFESNYELPGMDIAENDSLDCVNSYMTLSAKQMITRGFKLYRPNREKKRWVYKVTAEDMKEVPCRCFQAPWDATVHQPLRTVDILGMPEDMREIYWMPADTQKTYIDC